MLDKNAIPPLIEEDPEEGSKYDRKRYQKPELVDLGDLRTLTLGGSPGVGDSGSPGTQFPPG